MQNGQNLDFFFKIIKLFFSASTLTFRQRRHANTRHIGHTAGPKRSVPPLIRVQFAVVAEQLLSECGQQQQQPREWCERRQRCHEWWRQQQWPLTAPITQSAAEPGQSAIARPSRQHTAERRRRQHHSRLSWMAAAVSHGIWRISTGQQCYWLFLFEKNQEKVRCYNGDFF